MDKDFQDRIDEYLLHSDTMSEEAKANFLKEIEEDEAKKEQFELTKSIKKAIVSRGEKLKAMAEFQKEYEKRKDDMGKKPVRRLWLWASGIAAVLVVGFFAIKPVFVDKTDDGNVRGGDDIFVPVPTDSIKNDTITSVKDSISVMP